MSELAGHFCSRKNLSIHLVLFGIRPEFFYNVPATLTIHKPQNHFNNKHRFISTLKRLWYVRETVKSINPDTVLSFGELWNSFVILALWGLRYPVFISDRCNPARSFKFHNRLLRRVTYRRASGVIAQTAKAKELYEGQFRHHNIKVIGNPIRTIDNKSRIERKNVVLTVGRLINTKHHDKLIETFAEINNPDWTLVIVGDDSLKQNNFSRLMELIRERDLTGMVTLAGKQHDIDRYYLSSRIFAFASSSEGFPNVIGEAMSAGLPVMAFDCVAGPADMIIDNHNGFLVPLFDWAQYKQKLTLLMEDENLRSFFGKNAQIDVKKYSVSKIGDEYLDFLFSPTR